MVISDPPRAYWAVVVGTGGLADAICRNLVKLNFRIVICGRSMVKLEGLAKKLRHANPTNPPHLHLVELDLRSMMSIREAVGTIMTKNIMLKLIINAAGICSPRKEEPNTDSSIQGTKEVSMDVAFMVNFVGPCLFMMMLQPLLWKNRPSTVINVTCEQYAMAEAIDMPYVNRMKSLASKPGILSVYIEYVSGINFEQRSEQKVKVKVTLFEDELCTKVKKGTTHPYFEEDLIFRVGRKNVATAVVNLQVMDVELDKETVLCSLKLPLAALTEKEGGIESEFEGLYLMQSMELEKVQQRLVDRDAQVRENALLSAHYVQEWKDLNIADRSRMRPDDILTIDSMPLDIKPSTFVEVDKHFNLVTFLVEKKLNMFKKGNRRIVLDFPRKILRNEKTDGTLKKQFPLEQVSGCFADPQDANKVVIVFMSKGYSKQGNALSPPGGQRDYSLVFPSSEIRQTFIDCLSFLLDTAPAYVHGKIFFRVWKKLNVFQREMREIVLDLKYRKMHNLSLHQIDEESQNEQEHDAAPDEGSSQPAVKKQREIVNMGEHGTFEAVRTIPFNDIKLLRDVKDNPNGLAIVFFFGNDYIIEFVNEPQKENFTKVLGHFLRSSAKYRDTRIKLRVLYSRPTNSGADRLNNSQVKSRVNVPTTSGGQAQWMTTKQIDLKENPTWYSINWNRSQAMTQMAPRNVEGGPIPFMKPTESSRQSMLCSVAFTLEAARRSAAATSLQMANGEIHTWKGVQYHILEPGLMKTTYWSKADSLGKLERGWWNWKAQRIGADPSKVAAAIALMIRDEVFEEINGLYVKAVNGKPVIINLGRDRRTKLAPVGHVRAYDLKMHGIEMTASGQRASHPIAGAYNFVNAKALWEAFVHITGFDPEDPRYAFVSLLQDVPDDEASKQALLRQKERLKQKEEWIKLMASGDLDVAEKRLKEIIAEATADGFIDEDERRDIDEAQAALDKAKARKHAMDEEERKKEMLLQLQQQAQKERLWGKPTIPRVV